MKVAIICDSLDAGQTTGINVFIRELIAALARVRAQEEIILVHADPAVQLCEGGPFREVVLPRKGGDLRRNLVEIPDFLRHERIEVVHEPRQFPPLLPRNVAGVVTIHDLANISHSRGGTRTWMIRCRQWLWLRMMLQKYRGIATVSEWTAREVTRLLGIPSRQIVSVPLACPSGFGPVTDGAVMTDVRRRYGLDGSYLLNVGTIGWRKNQACLVRAYAQFISARLEKPLSLVIVGHRADAWNEVQAAIQCVPSWGNVQVLENVRDGDRAALYAGSELMVFPSVCEGFGLPVLEAQACGVPVVCTKNSALVEVGGESVVFIPDPPTPDTVAAAIEEGLSARESLVLAGTENLRRYSWDRCAEAYLALYAARTRDFDGHVK